MEAPSDKCAKYNWWTLLGEIRDEFEMELLTEKGMTIVKKDDRNSVISCYTKSAHKVCKEHWDGTR